MKQNRFRSKIFWLGIVSIIMLLMSNYGLYDAIGMTSDVLKDLIDLVFVALAAIGVFNNPTDAKDW